jgi:hypothetical protein
MQSEVSDRFQRWMYKWWGISERYVMIVSPFIFAIGIVLTVFRVPYVFEGITLLASLDLTLLSYRLTAHALKNLYKKQYKKALLFGIVALPLVGLVIWSIALGSMGETIPLSGTQLALFQLLMIVVATLLSTSLFQWYRTGKALQ